MILGDLSQDIIGTDPKYLPIVDHSWLNPETYDNYPSDNNPVRIQPKLAELWGHNESTGINLVPNLTIKSLGQKSAEDIDSTEVVREAKKAMMMGLKEKSLTAHIRARFSSDHIDAAIEDLQKLSEEQGLLGNVYIDASAFSSAIDAEQFLTQHRTRLARDIVVNESKLSPAVVSFLASKFHKNVVANINYDEKLFKKYKAHLIGIGHISDDFVIDSKETLRMAFLIEPIREEPIKAKADDKISDEKISESLIKMAEEQDIHNKLAYEEMLFREIRPIIILAREQLSKGKRGNNLKEILKKKYASDDLRKAAKYLAIVIPSQDMTGEIDKLIEAKRIPRKIGLDLKKIINDNPIKYASFEKKEESKSVGVKGFFYPLLGNKDPDGLEKHEKAAVELLRKGATLEQVKGSLLKELSNEKVELVLANAVSTYNLMPAGTKANVYVKPPKRKVVADLPERETLPDPSTIESQTQEYMNFFAGSNSMNIELDPLPSNNNLLDIGGLSSTVGLDEFFS